MSVHSEAETQIYRMNSTERILKQVGVQYAKLGGTVENIIDMEILKSVWSAFGLYLQKQLRMGRGVNVNRLGQFNFTPPEYNLIGSTNPVARDKQQRLPVFLVNKEFIKGRVIKQGIYTKQGLRAYGSQGSNGIVQQVMINYSEISVYANVTKDIARSAIDRIIRQLADLYLKESSVVILIPQIGALIIKNNIAAVSFTSYLREQTKNIIKMDLSSRIKKNTLNLSQNNLQRFDMQQALENEQQQQQQDIDVLSMDSGAKSYLVNNLGIKLGNYNSFKQSFNKHNKSNGNGYDVEFQQQNRDRDDLSVRSNKSQTSFISQAGSTYAKEHLQLTQEKDRRNYNDKKQKRPQTSSVYSHQDDQQSLFTQKMMLSRLSQKGLAVRKLKEFLRFNNLDTEEGFIQLVQASIGHVVFNSKLSYEQLVKGIHMLDIQLNELQIQDLFQELDNNQDGYVDFSDFSLVIQQQNDLLQKQRDVIQINQLETDDVLMRMNLTRDNQMVESEALKEKLQNLNEALSAEKASKLAQQILNGRQYISAEEILVLLEINDDESKVYNINWYKNLLMRLKKSIKTMNRLDTLCKAFEKYDSKSTGLLDVANYKTVLLKSKLGLSVDEINRMVRYTQKKDDLIDYLAVINDLTGIFKKKKDGQYFIDLQDFGKQLTNFVQQLGIGVVGVLKIVGAYSGEKSNKSNVNVASLALYLSKKAFPDCPSQEINKMVRLIDIDSDGVVNEQDLDNFLKKHRFYKQQPDGQMQVKLFPSEELNEDKIDIIIRDLRQILQQKKISYYELFQRLDHNQDGFISYEEFESKLEPIMRLSQPVKEGLFSYFDRQKVGLIDYPTFLRIMNKVLFMKEVRTRDDNWDWQEEVIKKLRNWYQSEGLDVEQAFKRVDQDFDGFLGKQDLYMFITQVLKYEPNTVNTTKVDRLFKLLDQYKRGCIQFLDFKRLVTEDTLHLHTNNKSNYIHDLKHMITNGFKEPPTNNNINNKTNNLNSFNWILNAKQQIGLVISRKFKSIQESFDIISGYKNRLLYDSFKEWIEVNQTLNGFDLTDKLLLEVYSSLDPHKKGYVTLNDFKNNFNTYQWQKQMKQEIQQAIDNDFEHIDKAYQFFSQSDKGDQFSIDQQQFNKAIHSIFPQRFNDQDLHWFWNQLKSSQQDHLTYQQFILAFGKQQKSQLTNLARPATAHNMNTSHKSFFKNKDDVRKTLRHNQKKQQESDPFRVDDYSNIQEKVRNILRQSDKTIDEVFKDYTDNKIDYISNIQFRNLFKTFNLGLTIREYDALINLCDKNIDGLIDINHFKKQIMLNKIDKSIIDRATQKISTIRQDIYDYLISPKNAFRIFNEEGNDKMSFQQFQNLINKLNSIAGRSELPFHIIKDLFEFIDLRKDNIIDINEWLQVFKINKTTESKKINQRNGMVPSLLTRPTSQRLILNKQPIIKQLPLSFGIQDNVKVESCKDYDQVMKIIGKNRKYLLDLFKNFELQRKTIDYHLVKHQIEDVLRSSGFQVNDFYWPYLLKFADKQGKIDYKFLLDIYKYKHAKVDQIPKQIC